MPNQVEQFQQQPFVELQQIVLTPEQAINAADQAEYDALHAKLEARRAELAARGYLPNNELVQQAAGASARLEQPLVGVNQVSPYDNGRRA